MALGSDNPFPKIVLVEGSTPSSPPAGRQRVFIASADNKAKRVNSAATVKSIDGDLDGPASAVADRIAVYNGTTGKLLKDGGQTIASLIAGARVDTDQTQAASAAYGDLATAGPAVTLTLLGTTAIVWVSALTYKTGGAGNSAFISPAVSGASTVAASDTNSTQAVSTGASNPIPASGMVILTGLTPGSNTFTLKYHNDGGTDWHFYRRAIAVFAP